MPFRVQFFHQVQQSKLGGWSENFWNSGSNRQQVIDAATALRARLFECKGFPVQIPNIRISDTTAFREVTLLEFNLAGIPAVITEATGADFVDTALLLNLRGNPNYSTNQWMRGIYDAEIRQGGRYIPRASFVTQVNAFIAQLTSGSNGWALRKLDPGVLRKTITGITQAGVVSSAGHGLVTDDLTRISRVVAPSDLNKIWRVVKIDNDTFSIVGPPTMTGPASIGISTSSRKQSFLYVAIASGSIIRATRHKTGRPFGQLSGRRKTRRT